MNVVKIERNHWCPLDQSQNAANAIAAANGDRAAQRK